MTLATADVDFLRCLVAEHSGNVIAPRQVYLLEQRLSPVAKTIGLEDVSQLVAELRNNRNQSLSTKVAEAVTVNETSFYRDAHLFEALAKSVLPEIINRNQATKKVRIWCAASSSGQEPYSLAMTIREACAQLTDWSLQIVASDLSDEMLSKCRSGEYSQLEVNRGLPVKKLIRFFEREGAVWRVKSELKNMIEFRRINLTQPWPYLGQFDIVLVRNVLIYFDQPTKLDILNRVRKVMTPDGYLFIGSAETVIGMSIPFQRKQIDGTVSYRPTNS